MHAVLDPEFVTARIAAELEAGFEIAVPGRVHYVRYKPRTSGVVAYRVGLRERSTGRIGASHFYAKCHRHDDWERALEKLRGRRWAQGGGMPAVLGGRLDTCSPFRKDRKCRA